MSQLTPLQSQEQFEILLGRVPTKDPIPPLSIVYFTAKWCGACKRLDLDKIVKSVPHASWLKCDIDENDYTAGFCGIRSIPTFLVLKNMKVEGTLGESKTENVIEWLKKLTQ
jgi:thioredoxin-like negative regulator of GroEL